MFGRAIATVRQAGRFAAAKQFAPALQQRMFSASRMLVGGPAPDFTAQACLKDNSYGPIKLSDYKDKKYVVLFFWPADFTFVCASEVAGFEKLLKEFHDRDCEILGASTDTQFVHRAWKSVGLEHGGIGNVSYPMLADPTCELARKYDCLIEGAGLCVRGLFLIDKQGVVQAESRNNLALGRNLEEASRLLDALQYHEKSVASGNAEVVPACWTKGKKGMGASHEGMVKFAQEEGGFSAYVKK